MTTAVPIPGIDPDALYGLTEAARLLPCSYAGKRVSMSTLHRWRREGRISCVVRKTGNARPHWFVRGSELLKLYQGEEVAHRPETRAEIAARDRATDAALERHFPKGRKSRR